MIINHSVANQRSCRSDFPSRKLGCRGPCSSRDRANRTDETRPFLHTQQSEMPGRVDPLRIKTKPGILNAQMHICTLDPNLDVHGNVPGMLLDIPQGLLADPVESGGGLHRNGTAFLNSFKNNGSGPVALILVA